MMSTIETVGVACLATLRAVLSMWYIHVESRFFAVSMACLLPLIVDGNERVGDISHLIQPFDPVALLAPSPITPPPYRVTAVGKQSARERDSETRRMGRLSLTQFG